MSILERSLPCPASSVLSNTFPGSFSFSWKTKQLSDHVSSDILTTVVKTDYFRFAIWNTMMGTSLLSMPWALEQVCIVELR